MKRAFTLLFGMCVFFLLVVPSFGLEGVEEKFRELEREFEKKETVKPKPSASEEASGKVLLEACGFEPTEKEARLSALKALSQQIIAQIEAKEKLLKKREGGKISRRYVSSSTIISKSLLKGVKFEVFEKKGGYEVCAYFTEGSLKDTVEYLKSVLSVDLKDLDRSQLEDLLIKAEFLLNIAFLSKRESELVEFATNKINEINRYLNYGRLVVNVMPEDAEVLVDGKRYSAGKVILLPPEREYLVKVKREGYKTEVRKVYLGRGEKRSLTVELAKLVGGLRVSVKSNNDFVLRKARSILSKSGFVMSDEAGVPTIYLKVEYEREKTVDEYLRYVVYLSAEVKCNGEVVKTITGRTKPFFAYPSNEITLFRDKASKLVKAVLKKVINEVNFNKCR